MVPRLSLLAGQKTLRLCKPSVASCIKYWRAATAYPATTLRHVAEGSRLTVRAKADRPARQQRSARASRHRRQVPAKAGLKRPQRRPSGGGWATGWADTGYGPYPKGRVCTSKCGANTGNGLQGRDKGVYGVAAPAPRWGAAGRKGAGPARRGTGRLRQPLQNTKPAAGRIAQLACKFKRLPSATCVRVSG